MIKINTCHIGDEPLPVDGIEPCDLLALDSTPELPLIPVSDIEYHLFAVLSGQDLLVTGSAAFTLETVCCRCMKEMQTEIRAGKICIYREKVPDQEVDITDDVREELLLNIPDYIRCSEDCKGLCPHCGADLNDGPCGCEDQSDEPELPPDESPWSALDGLKK